ncbi:hypothetical protein NBZ79_12570 [Sneathiella marina]|uniref:RES domain-containing protein n=1 Tax=Sneathiella marina TaxID=2950108 RepID=A0ABY4VYK5_9PROT|nr:hypothetical protein [Sneathiella marina]USG60012.1 hypothetical protein NBZ79_12570 [Sneathiella marina]
MRSFECPGQLVTTLGPLRLLASTDRARPTALIPQFSNPKFSRQISSEASRLGVTKILYGISTVYVCRDTGLSIHVNLYDDT